jgi:hypothetical protein
VATGGQSFGTGVEDGRTMEEQMGAMERMDEEDEGEGMMVAVAL